MGFLERARRFWKADGVKPPYKPGGLTPEGEIPRYPPFVEGIPAVSVDQIMETQKPLIERVDMEVGLTDELTQLYFDPLIRNFAAYVHLLPASAAHHHRGAGGLFRHGLEVAMWGVETIQGELVGRDVSPEERYFEQPKWRYACLVACLCHDIGKIVTDMRITDKTGSRNWSPYQGPLADWLKEEGVRRYMISWEAGRHKAHETVGTGPMEQILPREARSWLHGERGHLIALLYRFLSGLDPHPRDEPFYNAVRHGEKASVRRDLEGQALAAGEDRLGVPVSKYLIDAMRRLLTNREWQVNTPGARLWVGHRPGECYLVWPDAAQDIVRLLREDEAPGIPGNPDVLAEILWDHCVFGPPGASEDDDGMAVDDEEDDAPRMERIAPEPLRRPDGTLIHLSAYRVAAALFPELESAVPVTLYREDDGTDGTGGMEQMEHPMEQSMEHPMEQVEQKPDQGGVPSGDPGHGTGEKKAGNQPVPSGVPRDAVPAEGTGQGGVPSADEAGESPPGESNRSDDGTPGGTGDGTTPGTDGTPAGTDGTALSDLDEREQRLVRLALARGWSLGREWAVPLEALADEPDLKPIQIVRPYQDLLEPDPDRPMSAIRRTEQGAKYVALVRALSKRVEQMAGADGPTPDSEPGTAAGVEPGASELDPAPEPGQEHEAASADPTRDQDGTDVSDRDDGDHAHPGAGDEGEHPAATSVYDSESESEELGAEFAEWLDALVRQQQGKEEGMPRWIVPGARGHWVVLRRAMREFARQRRGISSMKLATIVPRSSHVQSTTTAPEEVVSALRHRTIHVVKKPNGHA